jgi:hypothetical protein
VKTDYRTRQNRIGELWTALKWKSSQETESELLARYAKRWGISDRQMYRYLREAREVSLPASLKDIALGPKQLFSVRLSESILARLRAVSEAIHEPMSVIIENALHNALSSVEYYQRQQEETAKAKPLRKREKLSSQT